MPDYREQIDFLNKSDFHISGMFGISNDDSFRMIEFDCVRVSDRFAKPD